MCGVGLLRKRMQYLENGIISGIIRTAFDTQSHSNHARTESTRSRARINFQIHGSSVCRDMFLFCHNIKIKRFKKILRTYKTDGFTLKRHGNCGRVPSNARSFNQYRTVANFIKNYAVDHALLMPGRLGPQYKLCKLLPSSETKTKIYEKYK